MAEAARRSITRRSMVAGVAAVVPTAALAACLPDSVASAAGQGHVAVGAHAEAAADPVHAAIAAHARAYAAYRAQLADDPGNDEAMEPLCEVEWKAAAALAGAVPATLQGAAAVLAHVRTLHERDEHPALDDFQCYVFIASIETALRRHVGRMSGA